MRLDTSFPDRLKWAIEHKKTNQSELSRAIGISVQAVQQWASGSTSSPNRNHLQQACTFLGCRYDWLCYGRGPMLEAQAAAGAQPTVNTDNALLAAEWESRLVEALPTDIRAERNVQLWHDGRRHNLPWLSATVGASWGLYRSPNTLVAGARARLWTLAIARNIVPPVEGRRWLLILSPLDDMLASEKHIDALTSEARILGIEIVHCDTPDASARVLAGNTLPAIPEAALLGLDDSPVL